MQTLLFAFMVLADVGDLGVRMCFGLPGRIATCGDLGEAPTPTPILWEPPREAPGCDVKRMHGCLSGAVLSLLLWLRRLSLDVERGAVAAEAGAGCRATPAPTADGAEPPLTTGLVCGGGRPPVDSGLGDEGDEGDEGETLKGKHGTPGFWLNLAPSGDRCRGEACLGGPGGTADDTCANLATGGGESCELLAATESDGADARGAVSMDGDGPNNWGGGREHGGAAVPERAAARGDLQAAGATMWTPTEGRGKLRVDIVCGCATPPLSGGGLVLVVMAVHAHARAARESAPK